MVNHQASESSLDKQILQIFEDQEEKFSFPLTTQKQARDFVRLLNHQGFNYEMLSEEIGEKSEVFRGWRLGSGPDTIGRRILMRINKPIQEAMSCDVGTEEEMTLCSGLVEESKASKHIEGRGKIIEEVVKVIADNPIKTGKNTAKNTDTCTEIRKDSDHGKALRADDTNERMKSGLEVEMHSIDLKKSLDQNSSFCSRATEIFKANDTDQYVDHFEIMKGSPGSSTIEEHNRKHLDTMDLLEKQSTTLETTSIAIETEISRDPSAETKQNLDVKYESSKKNNEGNYLKRSLETGKDIVYSTTRKNSDPERNRSKTLVEHKLQIENSESIKDSELNEHAPRFRLSDDDTNNGHRSNIVSHKNDENQDKFQLSKSECQKTKSRITDSMSLATSLAPKLASSEMAIDSTPLSSLSKSSLKNDLSNTMTKVEENSGKQQESNAQNGSMLILQEKLKSDVIVNTESCGSHEVQVTATEIDSAIGGQTQEGPNLNCSPPDSSAKESGSLTGESVPQTTPNSPSIPVRTKTISHTAISDATKDENIDENYNSDLDLENTDRSTEERSLIEKIRCLKNDEKQNGPGYLFVFSDTPAATGTGKHRIRIGVSRFPDKKFKQALLFNPDIRMVTTVAVDKRKTALHIAQDHLKSMSLRGKQGWYWGSLDAVMATITRII